MARFGATQIEPYMDLSDPTVRYGAAKRIKSALQRFIALWNPRKAQKGSVCTSVWSGPNRGAKIKVEKMFWNVAFQFRDSMHIPWASNPAIYQCNWPDGCWEIQDFQKSRIIVSERGKWLPDTWKTQLEATCMLPKLWQYMWRKVVATHGSYLTSIGQVVELYLSKFGFGSRKLMPPMKKHVRSNMSDPKNLKICVKKNFGYSDLISD